MISLRKPMPSARAENHAQNAIRGVAALLVVISHARALLCLDWSGVDHGPFNRLLYALGSLGHQSVIVFFVLSGYWVGGAVLHQVRASRFSWVSYGLQRLTRLWVVIIPALVLTAILDRVGAAALTGSAIYQGSPAYHTVVP